MSFLSKFARAALVCVAFGAGVAHASAQEITPDQLAAALDVVHSAKASQQFDSVLPQLASQVEDRLIRLRPDLHTQIVNAVEATALKLAARRADLDNDMARVWAKAFTLDELKQLAAFYKSPVGQKFATIGGQVVSDSLGEVQQWSDRVGAELLDKSRDELKAEGVQM